MDLVRVQEHSGFRIPCGFYGSPGHVEMTALDLSKDPPARHTAELVETEQGDLDYCYACMLARSVGIRLADG